jgi:hypothetical protein
MRRASRCCSRAAALAACRRGRGRREQVGRQGSTAPLVEVHLHGGQQLASAGVAVVGEGAGGGGAPGVVGAALGHGGVLAAHAGVGLQRVRAGGEGGALAAAGHGVVAAGGQHRLAGGLGERQARRGRLAAALRHLAARPAAQRRVVGAALHGRHVHLAGGGEGAASQQLASAPWRPGARGGRLRRAQGAGQAQGGAPHLADVAQEGEGLAGGAAEAARLAAGPQAAARHVWHRGAQLPQVRGGQGVRVQVAGAAGGAAVSDAGVRGGGVGAAAAAGRGGRALRGRLAEGRRAGCTQRAAHVDPGPAVRHEHVLAHDGHGACGRRAGAPAGGAGGGLRRYCTGEWQRGRAARCCGCPASGQGSGRGGNTLHGGPLTEGVAAAAVGAPAAAHHVVPSAHLLNGRARRAGLDQGQRRRREAALVEAAAGQGYLPLGPPTQPARRTGMPSLRPEGRAGARAPSGRHPNELSQQQPTSSTSGSWRSPGITPRAAWAGRTRLLPRRGCRCCTPGRCCRRSCCPHPRRPCTRC